MDTVDREMVFESARRATFCRWPFPETARCSPSRMAEAGFYACGGPPEPDLAVCYLCGKEMDGWKEDEDPWLEHANHAPYCIFVQLNKPEKDMTLREFLALCQQFNLNLVEKCGLKAIEQFDREAEAIRLALFRKN